MEFRLPQLPGICRELHCSMPDYFIAHLFGGIDSVSVHLNLLLIQVKSDHLDLPGKSDCDGHTHIAQSHKGQFLLAAHYLLI